ncbi:hypothetical protein [Acetobacter tropicalis]|jgi:hypothetical protein|uniref:Uncharacterized protein n=1 Tax=Acetobacter tropicalis TaxID=104102 RepID=A0A094YMV1_9PROT|nr:hypothetical protein [Acetobacter tropicalis]KGB21949.1 hypothetical protein AtDm6_2715 [Acetobacter tropicalis]MBC9008420.1 hypothetical protein [Acetobacter tropicalis]MDO8173213.1 hypothetical protein [Acetobacter tropicalis]
MVDKKNKNGKKQAQDEKLDESLDDSFPASDPPSHSGVTGDRDPPAKPSKPQKKEGA